MAMHDLRQLGTTDNNFRPLEGTAISALKLLRMRLTSGKPKTLQSKVMSKPWILFTDGALEYHAQGEACATIGAVLISPGGKTNYFGCRVPRGTLNLWRVDGREHVIGLVELYACVVALMEWRTVLRDQRLILFVDNYGAQDCLVKGAANVETWRQLLLILEDVEHDFFANLWVTRVPSESNPADFPSRSSTKGLKYLEPMQRSQPKCPLTECFLELVC